jgi:serine/threonine protein kinase
LLAAYSYANVYAARMLGARVAVKESSSKKLTSSPSLYREIRYLRQAGPHPNIIQLYGAFREEEKVCLVIELHKHVRVLAY